MHGVPGRVCRCNPLVGHWVAAQATAAVGKSRKEGVDIMKQREGVLVIPQNRLSEEQVRTIDGLSREILMDPGLFCYNAKAAELYRKAGAAVEESGGTLRVRLPGKLIDRVLINKNTST